MSTSGKAAPLVGGELGVFCGSELGLSPLGWCGTAEEEGEERFVPPYSVEIMKKRMVELTDCSRARKMIPGGQMMFLLF